MASFTAPANPLSTSGTFGEDRTFLNGPQRLGIYALMLYLFVLLTRLPEILAIYLGTSGSVVLISTAICGALSVLSGSFRSLAASRLGLYMLLFHAWICITVPFSLWRGGSVVTLRSILQLVPMFLFIALLIRTEKHLRLTMGAIAASTFAILVYTMMAGVTGEADARLATSKGRFGNSNDLALFLLMGLPFWIYMAVSPRIHIVFRVLAGAEIAVTLFQILRTGSRGAMITLILVGILIFLVSSGLNKLKILVLAGATILISVPLVPESIRARLSTLGSNSADESAAMSSTARMDLLMESLRVTARFPVFGAGLGMYTDAASEMSLAAGAVKPLRQVPHNTFTSISAETGIPGVGFYIFCLFGAAAAIWRARRMTLTIPGMQDFGLMCSCVLLAWAIFFINNFFFSLPGDQLFYLVCGISMAGLAVAQERYAIYQAARASSGAAPGSPLAAYTAPLQPAGRRYQAASRPEVSGKAVQPYGDVPWARNPRRRS